MAAKRTWGRALYTTNDLLHRASAILKPVWARLLDVVRARHVVAEDETRLRLVRDKTGKTKNGPLRSARGCHGKATH